MAAGAAHADAFAADFAAGLARGLAVFFLVAFAILAPIYVALFALIEAYALSLALRLRYRRCFGYAVLAVLAVLLGRCCVVTLVAEGLVLARLLRRERGAKSIVGAVALANVLTYVASAVVLIVLEF
jgi:hypothetical protein